MNRLVKKSSIHGRITAPSSKSDLQRLFVCAMLSNGTSEIEFQSLNEDSEAVLNIAKLTGSNIAYLQNRIKITGGFNNPQLLLNVGESGLGLRMLAPVLAATGYAFEIHGKGSLLKRPVGFVVEALRSAGVSVKCPDNSLPLSIKGPITVDHISLDGSVGSQLLTGFLMAAPLLNRHITIEVENLKSRPYIDLTISILNQFGIDIHHHQYEKFEILGGQNYKAVAVKADGDWSGIAFMLVAAAISGEIAVEGIRIDSPQGDKVIIEVLKNCGAEVITDQNSVKVRKNQLKAFEFDATDVPDLFPPLVALALNCTGKSVIKGVSRLKNKESDRGQTLQSEFNKIGANIIIDNDMMIIEGTSLYGGKVYSHNDHRIAMALAIAGLNSNDAISIENSEAVGKSWPDFFENLKELGAIIE